MTELYRKCISALQKLDIVWNDVPSNIKAGIQLLIDDGLIAFTADEEGKLTPESLSYLTIIALHDSPLGAANLLSTLKYFDLLSETYALRENNLSAVSSLSFPEALAAILDRIFSQHPPLEKSQSYFNQLQRLSDERIIIQLQYQIMRRNDEAATAFTLDMFEDELQLALHAHGASRENLLGLSHDREAAIQPLTADEQRALAKAMDYYMPRIVAKGGVDVCYEKILNALARRYNQHPLYLKMGLSYLMFTPQETFVRLPLERSVFDTFVSPLLTAKNRERAHHLYYKSPVHTAYRFFKDIEHPSAWLASTQQYWEPFVQFKPLLAMLWLAVTDPEVPAIDEYTIETRIDNFIASFAEFRRGHNSDRRRPCSGKPGQFEFYDDEEGDKPSCILSFRQRAFDAVQGHPLFKVVTFQIIKYEVYALVLRHFNAKIAKYSREKLAQAWSSVCDLGTITKKDKHRLAELNVSRRLQAAWLNELKEKYVELVSNPTLIAQYQALFEFTNSFPTHAHRFGGELELHKLLAPQKMIAPVTHSIFTPMEMNLHQVDSASEGRRTLER